jgi:hypothetical protein
VKDGTMVVIATAEELTPYYILQATGPAETLTKDFKDSYGLSFKSGTQVGLKVFTPGTLLLRIDLKKGAHNNFCISFCFRLSKAITWNSLAKGCIT